MRKSPGENTIKPPPLAFSALLPLIELSAIEMEMCGPTQNSAASGFRADKGARIDIGLVVANGASCNCCRACTRGAYVEATASLIAAGCVVVAMVVFRIVRLLQ